MPKKSLYILLTSLLLTPPDVIAENSDAHNIRTVSMQAVSGEMKQNRYLDLTNCSFEADLSMPFYDFEARIQLPTLGLLNRLDPQAATTPWLNTYSYCGANPINYVDPTVEAIETLADICFVGFDVWQAVKAHINGNHNQAKEYWIDAAIDPGAAIEEGNRWFELRSDIPELNLFKGDKIEIFEYQRIYKYKVK